MNWEEIIKATEEKPLGYTPTDYDREDNAGMGQGFRESKAPVINYLRKLDSLITTLGEAYEDFYDLDSMLFFTTDPRWDMDRLIDKLTKQREELEETYEIESDEE